MLLSRVHNHAVVAIPFYIRSMPWLVACSVSWGVTLCDLKPPTHINQLTPHCENMQVPWLAALAGGATAWRAASRSCTPRWRAWRGTRTSSVWSTST